MKVYKYRTLSLEDEEALARLERIVCHGLLWCARPDTLNDPLEFAWTCDFTESLRTVDLLAELLENVKGRAPSLARQFALNVVHEGRLGELGAPVIEDLIQRGRDEIGIVCFGTAPNNNVLWARYAGGGAGACVEFTVPDSLMGTQLHWVVYNDQRRLHVDEFLRSRNELSSAAGVYATLLTKTKFWEPEGEVRFLSKRQKVEVAVDGSEVTRVILGPKVPPLVEARVRRFSGAIPVVQLETTA